MQKQGEQPNMKCYKDFYFIFTHMKQDSTLKVLKDTLQIVCFKITEERVPKKNGKLSTFCG